jgi:hypothetical protein
VKATTETPVARSAIFPLEEPEVWRRRVRALDADISGYLFALLLWMWTERDAVPAADVRAVTECPARRLPALESVLGTVFELTPDGYLLPEFARAWKHLAGSAARQARYESRRRQSSVSAPSDGASVERHTVRQSTVSRASYAPSVERHTSVSQPSVERQSTLVHQDLSGDLDPERASDPESAGTADRSDVRSSSRKNPDAHRACAGALDRELTALVWAAAVPLARDFWDSAPAAAMVETDRVDAFKTYLAVRGFAYHAQPDMPGHALTVVAREHAPEALPPSPIDVALETAVEALTGRDAVNLQVLNRACFDIVNEDPRWRGPDQAAFRESVLTLCYREATYRADPRFDVHADGPTVTVGLKE